ncbi:MAG TPA: TetR/AcrR family transcriptional regulator [Planctomycetota bacterium]|nr:TetR/AcrR family transcriptional regulator [Planctomycetota bacterium]
MSTRQSKPAPARRKAGAPARRRGRAAVERTDDILATAAEVFAREGYRNADLQDVADALGIGKGSLYRRFPSKGALFLAAVDGVMQRLRASVDAAVDEADDALEQIASAVRAYLKFFDGHPHYVELLIQERADFRHRKQPTYFAHRRNAIQRWRALYERLMDEGRVRRMPVERITDVLSSAVYGTMFTNYFAGRTRSFERQSADILEVVFHGILAPGASGLLAKQRADGEPAAQRAAPAERAGTRAPAERASTQAPAERAGTRAPRKPAGASRGKPA